MKRRNILNFIIMFIFFGTFISSCNPGKVRWAIVLEQPEKEGTEVGYFYDLPEKSVTFSKTIDGIKVAASFEKKDDLILFKAETNSATDKECYLSLKATYTKGTVYSYNGLEENYKIFRQSPHDPKNHNLGGLVKQALPMVAIKGEKEFLIAISNSPALYDNYTTQLFDVQNHEVSISSGDCGKPGGSDTATVRIQAYYHPFGKGKSHIFEGIILKSDATELNDLRKDALFAISKRWGEKINDRFGATAFASNYMLLRKNETANSQYWVVAGIEYANKLYSRDCFWQSMVLPEKFSRECYRNEAKAQSPGAERPLFCMIWAYRTKLQGGQPDMEAAKKTLNYIEQHTKKGWYYSSDVKERKSFQSWYDLVAFEENDVITYNQGLLAVALLSAEGLGLHSSASSDEAIKNYQSMFNEKGGYFPLSQQKDLLAVDPLVGDLLAQIFFDKPLLSDKSVISHFNQVVSRSKTKYGYKVTCLPNGDYAPKENYGAKNFAIQWSKDPGSYQWGGSWYLYDMLFLIDSYLHGAPGSKEEVIWRGSLDFKIGGTYFEYLDTVTGEPNKANQGWDAAVYAIWKKLIEKGKADSSLFEEIDKI